MSKKQKPEPDNKEQSQRFIETAKKLEADESGEAFERAIENISLTERRMKPRSKPAV